MAEETSLCFLTSVWCYHGDPSTTLTIMMHSYTQKVGVIGILLSGLASLILAHERDRLRQEGWNNQAGRKHWFSGTEGGVNIRTL